MNALNSWMSTLLLGSVKRLPWPLPRIRAGRTHAQNVPAGILPHCFGCYAPDQCSGVALGTGHCDDCVLDDDCCGMEANA
jgi:hypothetical protein